MRQGSSMEDETPYSEEGNAVIRGLQHGGGATNLPRR
jgi:hypothetical protein